MARVIERKPTNPTPKKERKPINWSLITGIITGVLVVGVVFLCLWKFGAFDKEDKVDYLFKEYDTQVTYDFVYSGLNEGSNLTASDKYNLTENCVLLVYNSDLSVYDSDSVAYDYIHNKNLISELETFLKNYGSKQTTYSIYLLDLAKPGNKKAVNNNLTISIGDDKGTTISLSKTTFCAYMYPGDDEDNGVIYNFNVDTTGSQSVLKDFVSAYKDALTPYITDSEE